MKKTLLAVALCLGLAAPAMGEVNLIGGVAGGYTFDGPAHGTKVFSTVAGTQIKKFSESTKLYTLARYLGNEEDQSWWGGKAVLVNQVHGLPWLSTVIDAGALDGAFSNADGTTTTSLTAGAGLMAQIGDNSGVLVYLEAIKRSKEWDMMIHFAPVWGVSF